MGNMFPDNCGGAYIKLIIAHEKANKSPNHKNLIRAKIVT